MADREVNPYDPSLSQHVLPPGLAAAGARHDDGRRGYRFFRARPCPRALDARGAPVTLASGLLFAAFIALWILPMLWILRSRGGAAEPDANPWRRAGAPLAIYAVLFLAGAWWWHVPLSTRNSLAQFASTSALPTKRADCDQLEALIAGAQEQSGGRLAIDSDGSVRVDGTLWSALPDIQRRGLQELGRQVAGCNGSEAPAPIRDMESGLPLAVE